MKHLKLEVINNNWKNYEISFIPVENKEIDVYGGGKRKRVVQTDSIDIVVETILRFLDEQEEH